MNVPAIPATVCRARTVLYVNQLGKANIHALVCLALLVCILRLFFLGLLNICIWYKKYRKGKLVTKKLVLNHHNAASTSKKHIRIEDNRLLSHYYHTNNFLCCIITIISIVFFHFKAVPTELNFILQNKQDIQMFILK